MKRLESQTKQLRKHLLAGKSIAPLQALNQYGIFRLSARVHDLIKSGMNIESKMIYEHPVKYAKYKLVKK